MSVYLITGNTNKQINEELKKITNNNEYDLYDYNNTDLKSTLENNSVNSLFSDNRIIVIKNADCFGSKSKDSDIIENYLKEDHDLNVIFITENKIDSRKKIVKILKERKTLIECPILGAKEIVSILGENFKKEGYKIDQETLYYIVNSSKNNYDISLSECEKIKIYYNKPTNININDVKNIVIPSIENNVFKLIDAIINHQIKTAFRIYDDLKLLKEEPIKIINLLAREYRLLLLCNLYKKKNTSSFEISKKLGLQQWQLDKYLSLISKYNPKKLKSLLLELTDIDYKIKSGKINKHLALEMFILKNC